MNMTVGALQTLHDAACTDHRQTKRYAALAVLGGISFPVALLALPFLVFGHVGQLALACICLQCLACAIRFTTIRDDSRPLDHAEPEPAASAAAFLFVPEALYRELTMRSVGLAVEVWRNDQTGASLTVSGVPPLRRIRAFARETASKPMLIVNMCHW